MNISQRRAVLGLLGILASGSLFIFIYEFFVPDTPLIMMGTTIATPLLIGLCIAYWWGWAPARYLALIFVILLIGFTMDGIYLTEQFTVTLFIPPILALIIADLRWVVGSAIAVLLILIVRAGGQGIYADPVALILYIMPVGMLLLARMVTDTTQRIAEQHADQARQAQARAEVQAQELAQKAQELEHQNKQQRQLLDLVSTLETPAVSLADGVLLAPLVGHLDSRRADDLTWRLLHAVNTQRTHMVILDIAGVPKVDMSVAQSLLQAIEAVRLLGCNVTITGISASVANTITQLDINMTGVHTARTPQEALRLALKQGA